MSNHDNHDYQTLDQLRVTLRDTQSPALHNLLHTETEKQRQYEPKTSNREAQGQSPSAFRSTKGPFLRIVSGLVGFQYALILYFGLLSPLYTMLMGMDIEKNDTGFWVYSWIWEVGLAAFGFWMMSLALKNTNDRVAVKAWTILAAGLAPVSAFLALHLIAELIYNPDSEGAGLEIMVTWLVTLPIHFFIPFTIFTLWVRCRYQRSEF